MPQLLRFVYEGIMLLLVAATIIAMWTESAYNNVIHWFVWAVFAADYLIRLFAAEDKWGFVRKHPFLLIAIIPFDQFFQAARIVRVLYLFRIKTITKYYVAPWIRKLSYQSAALILSVVLSLLAAQAFLIWRIEEAVPNLPQALWIVFGHLFFFGRQLYAIEHPASLISLTMTSILGVLVQGLALQWLLGRLEPMIRTLRG